MNVLYSISILANFICALILAHLFVCTNLSALIEVHLFQRTKSIWISYTYLVIVIDLGSIIKLFA